MIRFALVLPLLSLAAAPALADSVTAPLAGAQGSVTATAAPKGVLLHIEASGLTPGWHGMHFHEKGDCSDAAFKMAGGHVHAMTPVVHGLLNPAANDLGDLPNVHAGPDGKVMADVYTTAVMLRPGTAMPALADADGSAVVIHAKPDDYTTQPIGGAGDRVACAVIR